MVTNPTVESQEAMLHKTLTVPPHIDQGGGGTEHGIPAGGTTGQWLRKKSNADYDVEWKTMGYPPAECRVRDFRLQAEERDDNPYLGSTSISCSADMTSQIPIDQCVMQDFNLVKLLTNYDLSGAKMISIINNSSYPDLNITGVSVDNVWMPTGSVNLKYRSMVTFKVFYPADPTSIDPTSDTEIGECEVFFPWVISNGFDSQTSEDALSLYNMYTCMPKGDFDFGMYESELWYSLTEEQRQTCYVEVTSYLQARIEEGYFPEATTGNNPNVSVSGSLAYWDGESTKDFVGFELLYVEPTYID